jgi:hypothetical protein
MLLVYMYSKFLARIHNMKSKRVFNMNTRVLDMWVKYFVARTWGTRLRTINVVFILQSFKTKLKKGFTSLIHLTPKGLWVPYTEFKDFGHATTIPIFWNFFGGWEIQRAFQQAITHKILTLFAKVVTFSFFPFKWGHVVSLCHNS